MPNGENCSLQELEIAIGAAASKKSYKRMTAIRALLLGQPLDTVAQIFDVHARSLTRWIRAFNTRGINGLADRPRSGRPRKIDEQKSNPLREAFEHPGQAGRRHWTAVKFHGWLREEFELEVGYSTVVRWLHDQGFRLKVPQPWPDRQDEDQRRAFVAQVAELLADPEVDLWYQDEMGVEGDPRPRRQWGKKGQKLRATKNGDHLRLNVSGIVGPRTGEVFAMGFTHSDRECFQAMLDVANEELRLERKRNVLIMDNASWHRCKSLAWGRFEPLYLPPYSPDLNPIERLWLLIKAEWFTGFTAQNRQQLWDHLDKALLWAMNRGPGNQKTCAIPTKL